MSIVSRIKNAFHWFAKWFESDSDGGWQSMFHTSTYWHDPIKNLTRWEYLRMFTSWVYAAVTAISDSVVGLQYGLKDKSGNNTDDPLMKLITPELLEAMVIYTKLGGACYIWKVLLWKKILRLKVLRPDLMKVKRDNTWDVTWYEYYAWWKMVKFDKEEIMVLKNFDPMMSWSWYSEIQAAAITMQLDTASEAWNFARFSNSSTAGTILSTDEEVDQDDRDRLEAQREMKHRWGNNWHRMTILSGGLKYESPKPWQREMDFVNSQRWNMEKILSIFKVPKAMIGMGEWVNVGNVFAFEYIFAKNTILPLSNKIARLFNRELFEWKGTFCFDNVVPKDDVEIRNHYIAGGYMLNEYRSVLGLMPDKNWDVYIDGNEWSIEEKIVKSEELTEQKTKWEEFEAWLSDIVAKAIESEVKGTEAYYEKRVKKKNARLDATEKKYRKTMKRIFMLQKSDILKQMTAKKSTNGSNKWIPKLDKKYIALYISLLTWPQKDLIKQEWDIAIREVDKDWIFNVVTPEMMVWQKTNLTRLANAIDGTTDEKIQKTIEAGLTNWLAPKDISSAVEWVFNELEKKRLDVIVRTETARIATKTQIKAREQSGVVAKKEWYTALDERVCNFCWPMHWKTVALNENYFTKWSEFTGDNWKVMKMNYDDIHWAPLHTNCRCDLIPVLE